MNKLRIASLKKDENGNEEIKFKEKDDEEKLVPKHFFDYQIVNYLQKNLKLRPKKAKDKKIIISLFSQNRELSKLFKVVKDKIKSINTPTIKNNIKDKEYVNYLEKIGFYPSQKLEEYNVEYKLYDLCEQSLIYHLYLSNKKNNEIKKSILFIQFDKVVVNAAIFNERTISTEIKKKEKNEENSNSFNLNNINISDENEIFDLIKNSNDIYEEIELVLSYVDNNDENKKDQLLEIFDKIKKYCQEKINPPVIVYTYEKNEITYNVFNCINLFYNN